MKSRLRQWDIAVLGALAAVHMNHHALAIDIGDEVEPPLEFRHLQSARLFAWRGATDDPDVQLVSAVRRVVERSAAPMPSPVGRRAEVGTAKSWWETPAGWAAGTAALLLAAALLVMVLRMAGLIGGTTPAPHELAVQSDVRRAELP